MVNDGLMTVERLIAHLSQFPSDHLALVDVPGGLHVPRIPDEIEILVNDEGTAVSLSSNSDATVPVGYKKRKALVF